MLCVPELIVPIMIPRRTLVSGSLAALACPALAQPQSARVLRFIPQADLVILDPVWTSVYVTRNHGYAVFDTLYGQDSSYTARPQMVEGAQTERNGLEWRLRLRAGLRFHDGEPVLARDCVASILRWGKRDSFGQILMARTLELTAADDRTIVFRLSAPCPWLPEALGKIGINMLPIMPERLAKTDAFTQITEMVGSGPFRFLANEQVPGARVVYAKFDGYQPRPDGVPEWTAGPKIVHFDRVEWNVVPDPATAAAALQRGEADWLEQPIFDLVPTLAKQRDLDISVTEVTGNIGLMRFNALHPPFDNPAIRRALLPALNQATFMAAVAGDQTEYWQDGIGYFPPGTPMASEAGMSALSSPRSFDRAKTLLAEAGYKGERVVLLSPGDYPRIAALSLVAADMLTQCGMNVDVQTLDWGGIIRRRANKASPDQGGWSIFFTTLTGADLANPASNPALRGNGTDGWFGWPTAPQLDILRDQWLAAPDVAQRRTIAAFLQRQAFEDVPFLPLGRFFQPTARSKRLVGALTGMSLFWNIRPA